MQQELDALEVNNTCELIVFPASKKYIGSKCAYKTKPKLDSTVNRFKARLFTKVYHQIGIDCCDNHQIWLFDYFLQ